MQIVTEEKEVFNYSELSDSAKATAGEEMIFDEWYKYTKDEFHSILETLGFYNVETYFTGFSSQGDGACFTASVSYEKGCLSTIKKEYPTWTELHSIVSEYIKVQKKAFYGIGGTVNHSGHYYHELSMDYYLENKHGDWLNEDLTEQFKEVCRDLAKLYYKRLENDYEYQVGEGAKDTAEANEYTFTEDGKLYHI